LTVALAPATTLFEESVTVPTIAPVIVCPHASVAEEQENAERNPRSDCPSHCSGSGSGWDQLNALVRARGVHHFSVADQVPRSCFNLAEKRWSLSPGPSTKQSNLVHQQIRLLLRSVGAAAVHVKPEILKLGFSNAKAARICRRRSVLSRYVLKDFSPNFALTRGCANVSRL